MTHEAIYRRSTLFAILANAIFGFSFLFSKRALAIAPTFVLLSVRFIIAFLILNLFVLFGKARVNLKGKNMKQLILLGVYQPVLYFIFEIYGIGLVPTSFVGIMLALIPVTTMVLGFFFLGERVTRFQGFCALLSIVGVFFTTMGQPSGSFHWVGFVLLLGAVLVAALFGVLTKQIAKDYTTFERTYVMFALGSIVFTGIAIVQSYGDFSANLLIPLASVDFWIPIFFLAGISSVGAFLMLNYAMGHLHVAKASIFGNIATVVAIVAGVVFLNESFGAFQLIGSAIILFSVYGVNR